MSFTIIDAEQRSPEWFAARCGLLTGSKAADVFAYIKSGAEAAARRDLRIRLALERMTGEPQEDGRITDDMTRGTMLEPEAVAAYEARSGDIVRRVGFLRHTDLPVGYSPDGVLGDFKGLLEVKCPKSATHYRYLLDPQQLRRDYEYQISHGMWISGAEFAVVVSYDPRFPPDLRLVIIGVDSDTIDLKAYELAVRLFLDEVEREYAAVLKLRQLEGVA